MAGALSERQLRESSLRRQHQAMLREGYDGHNRHGGITSSARLARRRRRRLLRQAMRSWTLSYAPRLRSLMMDSVPASVAAIQFGERDLAA